MILRTLIEMVLIIQALIIGARIEPTYIDIYEARDYVKHFQKIALESDLIDDSGYISVVMYRPEEKVNFPAYYKLNKPPPFGSSDSSPESIYNTFKPLFTPPPNWRAGADTCEDKEIVFNPSWLSESWIYYESPIWIEVAAHEVGHFSQGCLRYDDISKEWTADIIGLELLASSGRPESKLALLYGLRENLLGSIIVEMSNLGRDPREFLDTLNLNSKEREQFEIEVERCESNLNFCNKRSNAYYFGVIRRIINTKDSKIYYPANEFNYTLIDDLKPLLDKWFGIECLNKYCPY